MTHLIDSYSISAEISGETENYSNHVNREDPRTRTNFKDIWKLIIQRPLTAQYKFRSIRCSARHPLSDSHFVYSSFFMLLLAVFNYFANFYYSCRQFTRYLTFHFSTLNCWLKLKNLQSDKNAKKMIWNRKKLWYLNVCHWHYMQILHAYRFRKSSWAKARINAH